MMGEGKDRSIAEADEVGNLAESDVLLINAPFDPGKVDWQVVGALASRPLRDNLILILVSNGGDAATAYRVARNLQKSYKKITAFIPGWCKSAGTLCVLCAHELVIGDKGELGPLDVQIRQKDELGERSSGLVVSESLGRLQQHAFDMFQGFMLQIKTRSQGSISFRLAADIAAKMTIGLMEPLYRQIDPVQVGDLGRVMTIAEDYGMRLIINSRNLTEDGLNQLVQTYPSHDFVIDCREAAQLFERVREPNEAERALATKLGTNCLYQHQSVIVEFLNAPVRSEQYEQKSGQRDDNAPRKSGPKPIRKGGNSGNSGDAGAPEKIQPDSPQA